MRIPVCFPESRFAALRRRLRLAGAALLCLAADSCAGGPRRTLEASTRPPEEVLAAYVDPSGSGIPGLAVSVIRDGEVVYRKALGLRKAGGSDQVSLDDAFHIGSDTKAMTALLCGIFVDRGLLSWTSTISSIIGDSLPYRAEYRGVTLEQLLSHGSGLPSDVPRQTWIDFFPFDSPQGADRQRMVAETLALKPASAPGAAFRYSNLGYVVVGYLLERVSGKSWETLMREELFLPLGMNRAGFGPPARGDDALGDGEAPWGHNPAPVDPRSPYADNPSALGPAGTVHASLSDLERYLALYLHHGLAASGNRILSEASLSEVMKPRLSSYAFGWGVGSTDLGKPFLTHDGSNTMFYCSIVVLPEEGAGIIVLANRGDGKAGQAVADLVRYLGARFLGETAAAYR